MPQSISWTSEPFTVESRFFAAGKHGIAYPIEEATFVALQAGECRLLLDDMMWDDWRAIILNTHIVRDSAGAVRAALGLRASAFEFEPRRLDPPGPGGVGEPILLGIAHSLGREADPDFSDADLFGRFLGATEAGGQGQLWRFIQPEASRRLISSALRNNELKEPLWDFAAGSPLPAQCPQEGLGYDGTEMYSVGFSELHPWHWNSAL